MKIICEQHGRVIAIKVSPFLKEKTDKNKTIKEYVVVFFQYDGDIIGEFYLSPEYASRYDLQADSVLPMPNNLPEWFIGLRGVCKKCLTNCLDPSGRRQPQT